MANTNQNPNNSFKENAEEQLETLRKRGRYGSSSDLYVNEKQGIAVIGIQTSDGQIGHDTIYLFRKNGSLETILDKYPESGRMFPTGISEDGNKVLYTVKSEAGNFRKYAYNITKQEKSK